MHLDLIWVFGIWTKICYDKDAMAVTFNSTLRLEESLVIYLFSDCIITGVLKNKLNDIMV